MAKLEYKNRGKMIFATFGRRTIFFTGHSLDRWWERCKANAPLGRTDALALLDVQLDEGAEWQRTSPPWLRASKWHHARSEGYLMLAEDRGFIINRNASRDLVAVTYIEDTDKYRSV